MNESDSLFVIHVRMRVLISLCAVSRPSCMSDSNAALVLAFDALSEFLKAVSSISTLLSVFSDYNVLGVSLKRSHSA